MPGDGDTLNKRHVYILATLLAIAGAAITAVRIIVLQLPVTPDETIDTWRIEARIEVEATGKPMRVEMQLPQNSPGYTIISQNFVSGEFGLRTRSPDVNRQAVFSAREVRGDKVLYFQAIVHSSRTLESPADTSEPTLQRARYRGTELAAARAVASRIESHSSDNRSFQAILWGSLLNPVSGSEEQLLLGPQPTRAHMANTAVRIMALANIPARTVHGLTLSPDRRKAKFSHWTEIYDNGAWIPFDPDRGVSRAPAGDLPWWRGDDSFVRVVGGNLVSASVAVNKSVQFSLSAALAQQRALNSRLIEYSVFGLPIQTQQVFRILFVMPVGVFLLVILRNVIGVATIGTFMPVLIALGFRDTGLIWGIVLFVIVVSGGLVVRFYMERLKLLMVPRLGVVVMVVIFIMAILSVISFRLGFDRGLSVSLFPIVIMTMAIERMSTVWEERGPRESMLQLLGTMGASAVTFLVMNFSWVQHFALLFPESLLILIAATVLLGRYSGYRLVELPRFKVLAGAKK